MLPAVPDAWLRTFREVAEASTDRTLDAPKLVRAIERLSRRYTRERETLIGHVTDAEELHARLRFFLPRDLPKLMGPLAELAAAGALPEGPSWRVLDLGSGVGTTTWGAAWTAARTQAAERLEVDAFDRDPRALEAFRVLAPRAPELGCAPLGVACRVADVASPQRLPLRDGYSLILVGLTLNELRANGNDGERAEHVAAWLCRLAEHLKPDGALIVLEPALREVSRHLHRVRDVLAARSAAPYVFAPCLRDGPCPMLERERDWCHEQLPVALPPSLASLARQAGLRSEGLSYSYLTLRREKGDLRQIAGTAHRVVSNPLPSKGKTEWLACSDAGLLRVQRLKRDASHANADLERCGRGCVVTLEGEPDAKGRLRIGRDETVVCHLQPRGE